MVESRIKDLEKTMVEVGTDIKYIIRALDDVKESIKKFQDTNDEVILLKEKVKNLENDLKKAPSVKLAGAVATGVATCVAMVIEFFQFFI